MGGMTLAALAAISVDDRINAAVQKAISVTPHPARAARPLEFMPSRVPAGGARCT